MTKEAMIDLMNQDLKNEYKHMLFYLRSSVMVRGLHRQSIQGFLSGEATSELGHVTQFSTKIRSLGGVPGVEANPIPALEDPREILEYALTMEEEVVLNYLTRMAQAEELAGADGVTLRIFYENQLQESHDDMIEIKEMLASLK